MNPLILMTPNQINVLCIAGMGFYYTSHQSVRLCLATGLNLILSAYEDMDICRYVLMSKCDCSIRVDVTALLE